MPLTMGIVAALRPFGDFPLEVFLVDALLCATLVSASRLALRLLPLRGTARGPQRRVLVVGAGRSGRALARELAETPDTRVVGFLDDNTEASPAAIHGVQVRGTVDEADRLLGQLRIDEVLVTIPSAPSERLEALVASCESAAVDCRFVVREFAAPPALTRVPTE